MPVNVSIRAIVLFLFLVAACSQQWYTALVSNVDDTTFHYYSDVWFNSTPFNTEFASTKNALFEAYSTVYVDKVRITLDGTTGNTCGTECVLTFSLPSSHAGLHTLMDLVTADGGIEMSDDRNLEWKNADANYFRFQGSASNYYDKYYCHNFGLNYGNYERTWERYQQRSRARIGVSLNYYQPVGDLRAAEGIGLTYGWSRQWTDNVGSGRVESYSNYLFRPAKVEVFGFTTKLTEANTFYSAIKLNGYSKYPAMFTAFNSTLQNTLIKKNTFVMMFRNKRTTEYITTQLFRVGTSSYLNAFYIRPDQPSRTSDAWNDGRHWYHYTATTYSIYDSVGPYFSSFTTGKWMQLAFTTDMNRRCVWVDGFPVAHWPFHRGERLLSDAQELFQMAREYAGLVAEVSDFRFYYNELSRNDLLNLRSEWFKYHKGCGDGERDEWEECDDGNTISGDGCSSDCIREYGYVCTGGNSTSIQPDKCLAGVYKLDIDFESYDNGATASTLFSNPLRKWAFSVDQGWANWNMLGTYIGSSLLNMEYGSSSLATATCSKPEQQCCDSTFGKMIGGLRMCGAGCQLVSTFSNMPSHNYVRISVQIAFIDGWSSEWAYMFADGEIRMRVLKRSSTLPVVKSEACQPGVNTGANTCRVNFCGGSSQDDLTTLDIYFYHNKSNLELKFNTSLTSATSKAIGFVYLDMEVGISSDFIYQTEGAGVLTIDKKYGSHNNSKGISLRNNAFPSYEVRSGSSYSYLVFPTKEVISSNAFVEFSFNYYRAPYYYGGFYLTLIRADQGPSNDVFKYNLWTCPVAKVGDTFCSTIKFYRICFDSSYEPTKYTFESNNYCDERQYPAQGVWLRERVDIGDKFAFKYGDIEGYKSGLFYLQFGVYGDYYGNSRDVEVLLDDVKIGVPTVNPHNIQCPTLMATASSTTVNFRIGNSSASITGTPRMNEWNAVLIDAVTHSPLSSIQNFATDTDFSTYVKSLPYGSLLMVAHSNVLCTDRALCESALQLLGFTSVLSTLPDNPDVISLAGVGMVGSGIGKMPFSQVLQADLTVASAYSYIGCHSRSAEVGENFHSKAKLSGELNVNSMTVYMADSSSTGYLGCFVYGSESNLFSVGYNTGQTMTPGACALVCHDNGFAYARVYIYYCHCSDSYGKATTVSDRTNPISDTREVTEAYCYNLQYDWNSRCRGDYGQFCPYYSYSAWYRARSSEPFNSANVLVTCENSVSGTCSKAVDGNYGTYYQSNNIILGTNHSITLDFQVVLNIDSLRIHTTTYYLTSYELLCGAVDLTWESYGVNNDVDKSTDNLWITGIDALGRSCRYLKLKLLGSSGAYHRILELRVNYFPSAVDKEKYDKFTSTYQQTYYSMSRSPYYNSNAYANSILPVMTPSNAYLINNKTGAVWSNQLRFDFELQASYHVRIFARLMEYDSGWFPMSDVINYIQISHELGEIPWNVRVTIRVNSGPNAGYFFDGTGSVMIDGSEIDSVLYGAVSYPETYGGLLFAYDRSTVRLWAPSGNSGYIVNVNGGWGQSNLQSIKSADVRVRASKGSVPQFDSGWVRMRSQSRDSNSVQRDFAHTLGNLQYALVKVYYKAVGGANDGYVFEAVGSAQADDDGGSYGGVVFGYTDTYVRVYLPNNTDVSLDNCAIGSNGWSKTTGQNECRACSTLGGYPCSHKDGYAIYIPSGFGGGAKRQMSHDVDVRVRIWTYMYNKAAFVTEAVQVTSNGVAYAEKVHKAGRNIDRVVVVTKANYLSYNYYATGVTAAAGTDVRPRLYGGVIYAYNQDNIRLWAPAQSLNNMWHAYGQSVCVGDGWGSGTGIVGGQEATVKAIFYLYDEPSGIDQIDTSMMSVTVQDNNEIPLLRISDVSIFEDSHDEGYVVSSVSAVDADGTALTEFKIIYGNSDDAFRMNSAGQVLLNNPKAVDFEVNQNFSLLITVSDGVLTEVGTMFISVLDLNDVPILWPPYEREVFEFSMSTSHVGKPLNATDTDISQAILFYLLPEGNTDDAFGISACSGQIYVKNPQALDHEGISGYSSFNLTVLVTDDGENARNATYTIPITVLNKNDPPSWYASPLVMNVTENSPEGTVLYPNMNKWCTDPDYGDLLSYSILATQSSGVDSVIDEMGSGGNSQFFRVDNSTGTLTVGTSKLNFEDGVGYTLSMRCIDYNLDMLQDPPNLYSEAYISIIVSDDNDAPLFISSSLSQFIYENSINGTLLVNTPVIATDEDAADTVMYSIVSNSTYSDRFSINTVTGEVYLSSVSSINYEENSFIQLIILATDNGVLSNNETVTPKSSYATLNVTVGDVNEVPCFVNSTFTMNETTTKGSRKVSIGDKVATVYGTDPDIYANQDLTFSIVDAVPDSAMALFSVDNNGHLSADILVANTVSFEQYSSIVLHFQVQDNGGTSFNSGSSLGLVSNGQVEITVRDVNDYPILECSTNPTACVLSIDENSLSGTLVGHAKAMDEDGDLLMWSLVNPSVSFTKRFALNAATGDITVDLSIGVAIDYEAASTYVVTVRVHDSSSKFNGPGYDEATFVIEVADVAESPYFTGNSALEFGVSRAASEGSLVGSALSNYYMDDDTDTVLSFTASPFIQVYPDDGSTKYTSVSIFTISNTTGQISLIRSPQSTGFNVDDLLMLNITVSDGTFNVPSTVSVVVLDNNYRPILNDTFCSAYENKPAPYSICKLNATDPDGNAVTFSMSGSTVFQISSTGWISLITGNVLNYESVSSYIITVVVSDVVKYPQSDDARIVISVVDVNDIPIVRSYSFSIMESQPVGPMQKLTYMTFTDEDRNSLACTVVGSASLIFAAHEVNSGNWTGVVVTQLNSGETSTMPTEDFVTNLMLEYVYVTIKYSPLSSTGSLVSNARITIMDSIGGILVLSTWPSSWDSTSVGTYTSVFNVLSNELNGIGAWNIKIENSGSTGTGTAEYDLKLDFTFDQRDSFSTGEDTSCYVGLLSALDFETTPFIDFQVNVFDGGVIKPANVSIDVLNVNEAPTMSDYTLYLDENCATGTPASDISSSTILTAFDAENDILSFSIVSGNSDGVFEIKTIRSSNPAQFSLLLATGANVDYESTRQYTLVVAATETSTPDLYGVTATIVVNINNVNDVLITKVENTACDAFNRTNAPLWTEGGNIVVITGAEFGSKSNPEDVTVSYGPTGVEYSALNCSVTRGNNVEITCTSIPGVGIAHVWKVTIVSYQHSYVSSFLSGITTRYYRPLLSAATNRDMPNEDYRTSGGEIIDIQGTQIGNPNAFEGPSLLHFAGYSKVQAVGSLLYLSDPMEVGMHKCRSGLAFYLSVVGETISLVSDTCPAAGHISVVVQSKLAADFSQFSPISVSQNPCYFDRTDDDWDVVNELGRYMDYESAMDQVFVPVATLISSVSSASLNVIKSCGSDVLWRTYVSGTPRMYYSNFQISSVVVNDTSSSGGSVVSSVTDGYALLASNCKFNTTGAVQCLTPDGVGYGYRVRYAIAGQISDELIDSAHTVNYHEPVILSMFGSNPSLDIDSRGYTSTTPDLIYIRSIFSGSDSVYQSYGAGKTTYGNIDLSAQYWNGFYTALCTVTVSAIDSDASGYMFCRESGVCRAEQVDLLTCKPVAGTGASHSWKIVVGDQVSGYAPVTTSYKSPIISFMNPDQWPFSDTAGGDTVIILGDQFGPLRSAVSSTASYGNINAYYGTLYQFDINKLFSTRTESCVVTSAHEEITCVVGPGTGKNHSWQLAVAEQVSNVFNAASSYLPPILVDFNVYNDSKLSTLPDDVYSFSTEGNQYIEIIGRNFGPLSTKGAYNGPIEAAVRYVGDSEESYDWNYKNCTVTEAHVVIVCSTSAGVGAELKWQVRVDNQTNTVPSTSYAPPLINEISGVGFDILEGLDTRGGQYIDISGENFGPELYFVERIAFGPTGGEYSLHDPQSKKYNCQFLIPHKAFRCLVPVGFGQSHFVSITVAGQRTTLRGGVNSLSYKSPFISTVTPINGTTRGGYTLKIIGTNFGPSSGAVLSFWGVVYASYPLTYLSHEEMEFVVPSGQGLNREIKVGHFSSWCDDTCQQFSLAFNFTYSAPQLDRLIFTDSTVPGFSNLTLYGVLSTTVSNRNGGSFGGSTHTTYFNYEFLNSVWIFPYNVTDAFIDSTLPQLYDDVYSASDIFEAVGVKQCGINTNIGNKWSHDMINCLTAGTNGTVIVVTFDINSRAYQRSVKFLFKEKNPVLYTPVLVTSPFPAGNRFPTTGGFSLTVTGMYFGSLTTVGARPESLDILLYLESYMENVKCLDLMIVTPTNAEEESTVSCNVPEGQGKNIVVIVRKGGDGSKLMSDYIMGENCSGCISYDPPAVAGYSISSNSDMSPLMYHRSLTSMIDFPVYSMTTGIESVIFYGNNFGLPGGVEIKVSDVLLSEPVSHSHSNLTVTVGEGVGKNLQLSIQVANHEPVTVSSNGKLLLLNYFPPHVSSLSRLRLHTSGNEDIQIDGTNFGSAMLQSTSVAVLQPQFFVKNAFSGDRHVFLKTSAGIAHASHEESIHRALSDSTQSVYLKGIDNELYTGFVQLQSVPQEIVAWNHTSIVITTSEATGGTNKNLVISAGGQNDTVVGIDYYAPTITSISVTHAPTSGMTATGDRISIILSGSDFGSPVANRYVTFGDTTVNNYDLDTTHTTCELDVPAGQGIDVPISITVEGQVSNIVYFYYDPPIATSITPGIGDTDACNQWESLQSYIARLDKNPTASRQCLDKQYVTLSGYSFGTTGMKIVFDEDLVCETDSAGKIISTWNCFDCAKDSTTQKSICYQSHNEIVFWGPTSYGVNLTVRLYVDNRRDNHSVPLLYSFFPPDITSSNPGTHRYGFDYINASGSSALTIFGENLGGSPSWVSINFTGLGSDGQHVMKECADAKWNPGSYSVGDGFPYLTCTMPADIVGAKNMTIHVADQTVDVYVRNVVENSLFISACQASYDSSNKQTIYYGLRYYKENCLECPEGALCVPNEYEVDPIAAEQYWLSYYDVGTKDAEELCSKQRQPPLSTRSKCPVFEGCFPPEACTGANTCEEPYSYVLQECIDVRSKYSLKKYNNNSCFTDYDCNKGVDICSWDEPEKCSYCRIIAGSSEPGQCTCTAAPKCSLCKVKEYYRIGGKCVKCPQNVMVLIVLFVTALLVFVIASYYLNKYKFNLAFVAIGFDYFQVLAIFAASDIVWPPTIIKMFTISLFFSFDINITAPECAFPDITYESKWYATMFLPLMGGAVLFSMFIVKLVHKFLWRNKRGWKALTKHGNQLMAMFVIMLYYLYLPLLRKALEIVNCVPADPQDGHLYTEWTSINCPGGVCRCWEKLSDPQMQLLPFAVLSLLVYSIGYPLYVTYIIIHNKDLIKEDQLLRAAGTGDTRNTNPRAYDIRKKFHKLYYHFKPGKVYWMILVLIRKFWIAVAALLFRSNPTFQMSFILLVMFVCYILQVQHRPFMSTVERESELQRHRAKVVEALIAQDAGEKMDTTMVSHIRMQRIMNTVEKKDEVLQKRLQGQRGGIRTSELTGQDIKNFFWDFNNVELYLLGCAIFVCIAGIMFESDTYSTGNTLRYHLLLLTFLVIFVIGSSLVYFGVVFLSEVLTTIGYDTTGMFEMFMSKQFRITKSSDEETAQLELRHIQNDENPMNSERNNETEVKKAMEMASLHDENEKLMKQIAELKKREQMQRMSSFSSLPSGGVQTQKKLKKKSFETKNSGNSFDFDDKDSYL